MSDIARLSVVVDTSQARTAERDLQRLERQGGQLERGMDGMSRTAASLGAALAAAFSAQMIVGEMQRMIQAASNLQETMNKFNVVFRGMTGQANAWAENLRKNFAMSRNEATSYLASIQDLLVPMGMARAEAGKMSNAIVELAADLGSFNNRPTAQVIGDIQSALVGNYETMKKYGSVVTAATVQEKALAMGLAATKDELTASHKAQAAYQLILASSADAIGDMARSSDSYANQMKKLRANIEDVRTALGQSLMPIASEYLVALNEWIEANDQIIAQKFDEYIRSVSEAIPGMVSGIGNAYDATKSVYDMWQAVPEDIRGAAGYGIIGAILFGKTGAVLGLATSLIQPIQNIITAIELIDQGKLTWGEFANMNAKQLAEHIAMMDAGIEGYKQKLEQLKSMRDSWQFETFDIAAGVMVDNPFPYDDQIANLESLIKNHEDLVRSSGNVDRGMKDLLGSVEGVSSAVGGGGGSGGGLNKNLADTEKTLRDKERAMASIADEYAKLTMTTEDYGKLKVQEWYLEQKAALGDTVPVLEEVYRLKLALIEADRIAANAPPDMMLVRAEGMEEAARRAKDILDEDLREQQKWADEVTQIQQDNYQEQMKLLDARMESLKAVGLDAVNLERVRAEEELEIRRRYGMEIRDIYQEMFDAMGASADRFYSSISSSAMSAWKDSVHWTLFGSREAMKIIDQQHDHRISKLEEARLKEIERITGSIQDQDKLAEELAKIDDRYNDRRLELEEQYYQAKEQHANTFKGFWDSFLNSLLRALTDFVAEAIIELGKFFARRWLMGESGGGILEGVMGLFSESGSGGGSGTTGVVAEIGKQFYNWINGASATNAVAQNVGSNYMNHMSPDQWMNNPNATATAGWQGTGMSGWQVAGGAVGVAGGAYGMYQGIRNEDPLSFGVGAYSTYKGAQTLHTAYTAYQAAQTASTAAAASNAAAAQAASTAATASGVVANTAATGQTAGALAGGGAGIGTLGTIAAMAAPIAMVGILDSLFTDKTPASGASMRGSISGGMSGIEAFGPRGEKHAQQVLEAWLHVYAEMVRMSEDYGARVLDAQMIILSNAVLVFDEAGRAVWTTADLAAEAAKRMMVDGQNAFQVQEALRNEAKRSQMELMSFAHRMRDMGHSVLEVQPWMTTFNDVLGLTVLVFDEAGRAVAHRMQDMGRSLLEVQPGMATFNDVLGRTKQEAAEAAQRVTLFGQGLRGLSMPSIPRYASGTPYHPGGMAWVGELGPELVALPRGSRVHTADESRRMARGSNDREMTSILVAVAENTRRTRTLLEEIRHAGIPMKTAARVQ